MSEEAKGVRTVLTLDQDGNVNLSLVSDEDSHSIMGFSSPAAFVGFLQQLTETADRCPWLDTTPAPEILLDPIEAVRQELGQEAPESPVEPRVGHVGLEEEDGTA